MVSIPKYAAGTVATFFFLVSTVAADEPEKIKFSGHTWTVTAEEAVVENHKGRGSLKLGSGRVHAEEIEFLNGVIRFDVSFANQRSFIGAGWRSLDQDNFEDMYLRAHKANLPDTVQYTPVYNGLSAWQMFYDQHAIAPMTHRHDTWNQVKIVVDGDAAEIYYNDSSEPVLHIRDLDRDAVMGGINLRVSGPAKGPVYFSNFSISPLTEPDRIVPEPQLDIDLPKGLITNWTVSGLVTEGITEQTLPDLTDLNLTWQSIGVSQYGISNLAELTAPTREQTTVLIKANIKSDSEQLKDMTFGYSDRVRIYLNGERIYTGISGWRVRNYNYLGLVSLHETLGLKLKTGNNELVIAVSERFGGWAWGAAIPDQSGLVIE